MRLVFVASKVSLNVGSGEIAMEECEKEPEIGTGAMIGIMGRLDRFFIFMYSSSLAAATGLKTAGTRLHNNFAFTLVDGLIVLARFRLCNLG